jgi:hypothetical protein
MFSIVKDKTAYVLANHAINEISTCVGIQKTTYLYGVDTVDTTPKDKPLLVNYLQGLCFVVAAISMSCANEIYFPFGQTKIIFFS